MRQLRMLLDEMHQYVQAFNRNNQVLNENWQDKQNDKFREQFDRSVQDIKKMSEMFTEYSNYIAKITAKLTEYQGIR